MKKFLFIVDQKGIQQDKGGIILKNGIVVLSSIVENSDSKLKYSDLIADINSGKVESIQVESDGKKAIVQLKDEKIRKEVNIPDMQSFMAYTEDFLK